MTLTIVLVSLLAYLVIGFLLGRRDLPRFIEHQRTEWPSSYGVSSYDLLHHPCYAEDKTKRVYPIAAGWLIGWITLWPFWATCIYAKQLLVKQVQRVDPKAKDAEIAAMQKRIEELEYELEIQ